MSASGVWGGFPGGCCLGSGRARSDGKRQWRPPAPVPPPLPLPVLLPRGERRAAVMAAFPAGPPAAAAASSAPWSEGRSGGGAQPLLDEFTVPAEKSALLERSRAGIERLFGVHLAILGALSGGGGGGSWVPRGLEPPPPPQAAGRRIWLSLLGEREEVRSAKEYIKGLCEPELEEREHYPKDMHCIFVGAQRLFLNCLIQGTSADITILEIGTLNIKGGAEPVVMARSHIQQFVSLFKNNTSLLNGKESDVKKRFKQLVEAHADKYTMDLLILPSSLKKELLNLAQKESCRAESKVIDLTHSDGISEVFPNDVKQSMISSDGKIGLEEARNNAGTPVTELTKQMDTIFTDTPDSHFLPINGLSSLETSVCKERQSCKRRSSDAEERLPKKQFSLENNQDSRQTACSASGGVVAIDLVNSASSELESVGMCTKEADEISEEMEYKILVNFFKSMGYSQRIVEKVIGELGQSAEPLLLLEEIEKESKSDPKEKDEVAVISQNVGTWVEKDLSGNKGHKDLGHKPVAPQNGKRSLASVLQVQHKVEGKLHISNCENRAAPSGSKNPQYKDCSKAHSQNNSEDSCISQTSDTESDGPVNTCDSAWRVTKDRKLKEVNFVARGGAETSRPPVQKETVLLPACATQSSTKQDQLGHWNPLQLGGRQLPSQKSDQLPETVLPAQVTVPCSERRMGGLQGHHADPSVTGVQRFLESLKTPYKLELKNEPGRAHLKYIVIDGSNVAIAHGLHKFFSCRGIAIAVDYFWRNGHRKITVFVPQWRTKRDSNITEQHFLTQLQDVGILALTPARVVCGARIASHDDRFLLHLAEKTGGVIVTNDNLREFVDESSSWREIIQKRLLPYTFAGDIFMVPDDPMGRNGPGLERFLQEETSFRGGWTPYGLKGRGLPPFGTSHFLMQPENSGQPPKSPLPSLVPALPMFPPAPLANSVLPPHPRSAAETNHLKEALRKIFPTSEQREKIEEILAQHPHMRDLNALSAMVLDLG